MKELWMFKLLCQAFSDSKRNRSISYKSESIFTAVNSSVFFVCLFVPCLLYSSNESTPVLNSENLVEVLSAPMQQALGWKGKISHSVLATSSDGHTLWDGNCEMWKLDCNFSFLSSKSLSSTWMLMTCIHHNSQWADTGDLHIKGFQHISIHLEFHSSEPDFSGMLFPKRWLK